MMILWYSLSHYSADNVWVPLSHQCNTAEYTTREYANTSLKRSYLLAYLYLFMPAYTSCLFDSTPSNDIIHIVSMKGIRYDWMHMCHPTFKRHVYKFHSCRIIDKNRKIRLKVNGARKPILIKLQAREKIALSWN